MHIKCHAPTLSQARDNRVNPSGVINTFFELAQGFQTPVHTYNSPITGEYNKNWEETKGCLHIYIRGSSAYKHTTQTDPFYTKKGLIQHAIYKKVYLYKMSEKKGTHQASKKYNSCPAHGNRQHALLNLRRGKERVMSNFITQWVNRPHTSNRIHMKPNNTISSKS